MPQLQITTVSQIRDGDVVQMVGTEPPHTCVGYGLVLRAEPSGDRVAVTTVMMFPEAVVIATHRLPPGHEITLAAPPNV